MLSCKISEIFKNTFFHRPPAVDASGFYPIVRRNALKHSVTHWRLSKIIYNSEAPTRGLPWILWNFQEHLFCRTTLGDCFFVSLDHFITLPFGSAKRLAKSNDKTTQQYRNLVGGYQHWHQWEGKERQPEACNFIKKETLAQVFSCEFCEISKNTFFTEHL